MTLFDELKRRNVFRVSIAYIVMAWLVMQVADVILNNIVAPDWIFHVLLLFLLIGFPFAVFFAWAFEMTPDGVKREHEIDRSESITSQTGRKLDYLIIAVLIFAVGYFAYDKFVLSEDREAASIKAAVEGADVQPDDAMANSKSIAVLPFINMSSDKEQEYFSDGLSEELLNLLAKIPELQVAARTSSFSFKGQNLEIPVIAERLKVAHVLEGSVRKSGNQVRITAQLIHADDGYHLWSDTYDRTLDDVFAIQDEIAAEVVTQLKISLLGEAPKVEEIDPEAYSLYLQARHNRYKLTRESYEQAVTLYEQALTIDPNYAAAWAGLGEVYSIQASNGFRSMEEGFRLAHETAIKALEIDPEHAPTHALLGKLTLNVDNDIAAAARHYLRALQLEPSNLNILIDASQVQRTLNRLDDGIATLEYVVARDPVNIRVHSSLGDAYLNAGNLDKAIDSYRAALRWNPEIHQMHALIGYALLLKDEYAAGLAEIQRETSVWSMIGLPMAYHSLGQTAESDAALAELIETYEQYAAYNIAYVLAYRGETDRAFEWLDKAVLYNDPGLQDVAAAIEFANINDDPRWLPFLESIGMSPEQLAAIEFEVKLPE